MKSKRYTRALALLIAAFVCFAAHEAKAQELSTDQIYERATYIIVQQESERREYDTIRWRHNLRLMLGAPSYVQVAFLDSDFGDIDVDGIYARPTASDKLAQYRYYTTPTYMVPPISFEYNHYVISGLRLVARRYSRHCTARCDTSRPMRSSTRMAATA